MADPTASQAKLIQYLNEAYGKEMELETSLQAHIGMTTRAPLRKKLQQHLKETKAHGRAVKKRIKELGGKAESVSAPGPDAVGEAASTVQSVASKAVAAAKGPLHMIRGTGEQEKMLKNAKTSYSEEAEEIANYTAIEVLAKAVGDKETAQLARGIRREEERMQKFLGGQIETLTKAVVQDEIPSAERASSSKRRSSSRSSSSGSRSSSSSSRKSSSSSKSGSSKSGGTTRSKSRSGGSARKSASSSRGRSSKSGSSKRGGTTRSGGSARKSASSSRSGGSASRRSSSSS